MRYFINLSYDGKNYHGWQIQPGAITVQEVLNKALSTLLREKIEVVGAGRTDAGVNASMMIAHFDTETPLPTSPLHQLRYRLNKLLPPDIAIHDIYPVADDMHARFSATSRTYHYYIITEKSPFEPYAYRFPQPLDFDKMNEACKILFEYTDFTSFSKLHTDVKTNNCKIMEAHWDPCASPLPIEGGIVRSATLSEKDMSEGQIGSSTKWQFTIKADRFLRNMVRAIVGTLVDVGRGAITIEDFRKIIEKKDRCSAGTSVPGNALFLSNVTYPESMSEVQMENSK